MPWSRSLELVKCMLFIFLSYTLLSRKVLKWCGHRTKMKHTLCTELSSSEETAFVRYLLAEVYQPEFLHFLLRYPDHLLSKYGPCIVWTLSWSSTFFPLKVITRLVRRWTTLVSLVSWSTPVFTTSTLSSDISSLAVCYDLTDDLLKFFWGHIYSNHKLFLSTVSI